MSDTSKKPTKTPAATSPSSSSSSNSSASNQDSGTVRVIIGEIGRDTKTGVLGRGYSFDNGETFHVTDTIYGRLYGPKDGNAIWDVIHPKVKDTIDKQEELLQAASKSASDAVKQAEQAVTTSKVNSDAINAMKSAESEARADADKALSDAQAAIKNVSSNVDAVWKNIASVEGQVNSAQTANEATAQQLQSDIDNAKQSVADTNKSLDNVSASLDTYAKSATEQGKDITELKNQQGKLEADLAGANGNVTQLQATVSGIRGNLKETNDNVASLSATASQTGIALKNAQSQVAQVIARADTLQATIADQNKKIVDIKATADGASITASSANSTATEAKLTASAASVTASDAKSDVLTVTTTASDAKMLATNANSQAMEANATANNVSIKLSGIEKTANNAASQAGVATSKADSNAKQINSVANTVTTVQASVEATQKELSGKVDQATIDSTNKKLEDINAQVSVVAGEVRSKAEQTTVSGISTDLNDLKAKAESIEKDDIDFNDCKSQMNIFSKGPKNAPNDNYWWYLRVEPGTEGRVTQYAVSDRDNHHYTRQFISTSWTPWKETADSNDVANLQAQVDKHSTEISNNTKEIQLKADSQTVNTINQTVQQQQAQQKIFADQITSKVSSADVEKMVDGKGFVTKDLVESSITQASGKINESITNLQGNLQNITADLTGLQSTVRDKADQSQITQLTNVVQSKVSSEDYQTTISQLTNDINAKVSKGDLISQINMEAGQTLIQSKKLFLDADSVVISGKAFIPDAAIANLSLDKLTTGHITIPLTDKFGNEIELGREGIEISSLYSSIDKKDPDSSANSNDSSASSSQADNNAVQAASLMTSFAAIANQPDDSGGSSGNGNIPDQPVNPDHPDTYTKSASYRMRLTADGLRMIQRVHYKNDRDGKENDRDFTELQVSPVNAVGTETTDGANGLAFITGVDDNDYTTGNQPASFLALGNGKKTNEKGTTFHNLDVIYSATSRSGYPAGMNVNTHLHILPPGADHSIQAVWVSWSNWDGGEKYPALVQDGANWGGVAFPKSGRVTLFDANGRYYTPDRNTGIGPYNSYGG